MSRLKLTRILSLTPLVAALAWAMIVSAEKRAFSELESSQISTLLNARIEAIALSPDGEKGAAVKPPFSPFIVSISDSRGDSPTGLSLPPRYGAVKDLDWSGDSKELLTVSDEEAVVWQVGPAGAFTIVRSTLAAKSTGSIEVLLSAAYNANGSLIAVHLIKSTPLSFFGITRVAEGVEIYDAKTKAHIKTISIEGQGNQSHRAAFGSTTVFAKKADELFIGTAGGNVVLLNVKTGTTLRTFPGSKSPVINVCVSPDNTKLASLDSSNNLSLWPDLNGAEKVLIQVPVAARSLTFSPDNTKLLVSTIPSSTQNAVHIFDASSGSKVEGPAFIKRVNDDIVPGQFASVWSAAAPIVFLPDGKSFISGGLFERHADRDFYRSTIVAEWDFRTGLLQTVYRRLPSF